ncbi:MAG: hypothetical protein L6R37_005293 [Teloschistes peruensis]|nr:MAG: hypothetical protein L6R37_005293 [Teloschistes peruensis]
MSVFPEKAKQTEDDESHPSKRVKEKETKEALDSSSEESAEVPNREADKDDVELALEKKQSRILAADPNLVTWDGPDDGENPKNWTAKQRWAATLVVSSFTLISPVSSSMVAPALPAIAKDLGISNEVESQMVLSIFVLAYAIGPLFLGPLSEVYGRIPVLQITNLVYLIFNTAAGGCKSKEQMIAFRFLSGLGGVAAQVVGGGVLSDCWKAEQRGRAMAVYSLAPLLGPAIGPIAGGFITENTTWRWSFYATSIADVLVWISGLFFLRETYPPKLLHLKAKKLRQGTGNKDLHTEYEKVERNLTDLLSRSLVRPFRLLGTQPIVQVLAVYMAYIYGLMYLVLSTFPVLWADRYHESVGIVGLNYISMGLGFMIGAQVFAPLNDRIYRILKKGNDGVGKPEYRVPTMVPGSVLVPIGLFIYAWTAQYHTHWIGPNIGVAIFSVGAIASFQVIQTYIIDAYTLYAASALAAVTVLRSLGGFGFPLFAPYMYNTLDYGWGNSLLAFIAIGLGIPAPFLLWIWGESLRKRSPFAAGGVSCVANFKHSPANLKLPGSLSKIFHSRVERHEVHHGDADDDNADSHHHFLSPNIIEFIE